MMLAHIGEPAPDALVVRLLISCTDLPALDLNEAHALSSLPNNVLQPADRENYANDPNHLACHCQEQRPCSLPSESFEVSLPPLAVPPLSCATGVNTRL